MKEWQNKIGELVRETYKREGYSDVLIIVGGIAPDEEIHTQVFYPADTAGDFDFRFMVFAVLNNIFYDFNKELNNQDD